MLGLARNAVRPSVQEDANFQILQHGTDDCGEHGLPAAAFALAGAAAVAAFPPHLRHGQLRAAGGTGAGGAGTAGEAAAGDGQRAACAAGDAVAAAPQGRSSDPGAHSAPIPIARPPLPPALLLGTAGSGSLRDLQHCHDSSRDLACHSAASSLGTCSSLGGDDDAPGFAPGGGAAACAAAAGGCHGGAGGSAAATPTELRNVSFASSAASRRASLLGDSGRASRRISQSDGAAAQAPAGAGAGDDAPWWASSWSFGAHCDQNGRAHMEDRMAAADVSGLPAFAGFRRAGFLAVFDGHSGAEAAQYLQDHLLQLLEAHMLTQLAPAADAPAASGGAGCAPPPAAAAAAGGPSQEQLAAAPGAALAGAVQQAEDEIVEKFRQAACNAGSTLLAALLLDDKLHVANVGDCRAVLARGADAIQITTDHKPRDEAEAARIMREHALSAGSASFGVLGPSCGGAGGGGGGGGGGGDAGPHRSRGGAGHGGAAAAGALEEEGEGEGEGGGGGDGGGGSDDFECFALPESPVVTRDGYLYGELAVARALGSQHLKLDPTKPAFTHLPDIHVVQLVKDDDLLLLASDGLWDKVDNSEAVTAARRCMARDKDPAAAARALTDRAVRQGSGDNVSVVVAVLHDRGISLPKTNSMLFRRLQLADGGSRPATPATSSACATPVPAGSPSRCETPSTPS